MIVTKSQVRAAEEIQKQLVKIDPGFNRRSTPLIFCHQQKLNIPVLLELAKNAEFNLLEHAGSVAAKLGERPDMEREADAAFQDFLSEDCELTALQCWAKYFGQSVGEFCEQRVGQAGVFPEGMYRSDALEFLANKGLIEHTPLRIAPRGVSGMGHGRSMAADCSNWWYDRRERRRCRGANHGRKVRGKSLADKRRGIQCHRTRGKAVWV
jgi:hypothetical protein